ncbi:TolC family protein [Flaviaesturariibacter flavus]|uniref:TolC family protein n=1 Tax=Flaviaesturariibacter flavus TaxID=2502780 RepID=A0A4R1BLM2_9BACT|nr:TolC family protein [Flaviaesturariibacter flavus]TCJ18227.1 TolC family protein [Flaviaesturariibacter flavus]
MKNSSITARTFPLVAALLLAGAASAQRPLPVSEAVTLSLRNNKSLQGSAARIAGAQAAVREAQDRRLPDASVSGSYMRLNKPNVSLKSQQGNGGNAASPNSAAYGMANVSLPLYAGGRIRYGIESSQLLEKAARLDADADRESVVANTLDAYNNLFKARAAVRLVSENLTTARERVRELSNQERNGLLARNDLLKAQLAQSNIELALVDAQNNLELANVNMNLMLGLPDTTQLLPDSAALPAPATLEPVTTFVDQALKQRADLEALGLRRDAAATGVKAVRAERLPSLALTGGYVALTVPGVLTVTNAVNIGLGVKYDIGTLWKNKARVQAAQAREQEATAGIAQLSEGIRLQVHQRYLAYLTARKKIDVYATAIEQAEENDRVIRNKFRNGLATTTELLDADAALLQARLNRAFAENDANLAYYRLREAAGTLAGEGGAFNGK